MVVVAVAIPLATALLVGLRGWAAAAATAALLPVGVLVTAQLGRVFPPRLLARPEPTRYLPSTRTLPWNRPITLGLSDPPPSSDPKPEPGKKRPS